MIGLLLSHEQDPATQRVWREWRVRHPPRSQDRKWMVGLKLKIEDSADCARNCDILALWPGQHHGQRMTGLFLSAEDCVRYGEADYLARRTREYCGQWVSRNVLPDY